MGYFVHESSYVDDDVTINANATVLYGHELGESGNRLRK